MLSEMLSYPFMTRALVVGILISLCASLLGVSLVLKRYSMIGDGLSHVGFGALAVAAALNATPLYVAIPIVVVAAFIILRINNNGAMKGDSAVAVISTSSLAIGSIIITFSTGMNTDVYSYMFGSILAMSKNDIVLSLILSVVVLTVYIILHNKIFAVTFDENYAKATGIHTDMFNALLSVLTALTIVLGMRMMGALLISGLIIFPALSSMRLFKTFKSVLLSSAVISVVCFVCGLSASYLLAIPAGASIVVCNLIVYIISYIFSKFN